MKNKKYTIDEILSSMNDLDMGCCYIDRGRFKKDSDIWLDNDPDGNARFGQLQLKVSKSDIKIGFADRITKDEKNLRWKFEDYETVGDLTDSICEFSREYFSSFVVQRMVRGNVIK